MRFGLAQIDITPGEVSLNLERAKSFVESAASLQADVVVFPEVFSTGLQPLSKDKVLEASEKTSQFLENASKEYGLAVCGSFPFAKSADELPHNLFQFWSPEGLVSEYAKIHLISYLGEDERYRAGDGLKDFSYKGLRIRPLICYDLRFDYLFTNSAEDVDLYLVPACWPRERKNHWQALTKARAVDTQAYLIGVNRVGGGKKLKFDGGSLAFSPKGDSLIQASSCQGLFMVDVDASEVSSWRKEFPALKERIS